MELVSLQCETDSRRQQRRRTEKEKRGFEGNERLDEIKADESEDKREGEPRTKEKIRRLILLRRIWSAAYRAK